MGDHPSFAEIFGLILGIGVFGVGTLLATYSRMRLPLPSLPT